MILALPDGRVVGSYLDRLLLFDPNMPSIRVISADWSEGSQLLGLIHPYVLSRTESPGGKGEPVAVQLELRHPDLALERVARIDIVGERVFRDTDVPVWETLPRVHVHHGAATVPHGEVLVILGDEPGEVEIRLPPRPPELDVGEDALQALPAHRPGLVLLGRVGVGVSLVLYDLGKDEVVGTVALPGTLPLSAVGVRVPDTSMTLVACGSRLALIETRQMSLVGAQEVGGGGDRVVDLDLDEERDVAVALLYPSGGVVAVRPSTLEVVGVGLSEGLQSSVCLIGDDRFVTLHESQPRFTTGSLERP